MTLREARIKFTYLFSGCLISKAVALGYECAFDEITQHQGKGHKERSLHYSGCAGDLLLYDKKGNYLPRTESYKELGEYWEKLDLNCRWGGRWGDGNHFSYSPFELFGNRA